MKVKEHMTKKKKNKHRFCVHKPDFAIPAKWIVIFSVGNDLKLDLPRANQMIVVAVAFFVHLPMLYRRNVDFFMYAAFRVSSFCDDLLDLAFFVYNVCVCARAC